MKIIDFLHSNQPILYDTDDSEFPYALSGTCFPVRYGKNLFIVSANHCYTNSGILPEKTFYPRPDDPRESLAIDRIFRAHAEGCSDNKNQDQVILRVSVSHHSYDEIMKIVALDLSVKNNSCLPTGRNVIDFQLYGYPKDAPEYGIDFEKKNIRKQGYLTNGKLGARKSAFDFCYWIKMVEPIPDGMSPNGMSGTPVYGITYDMKIVYCGTITEFSYDTKEYLAIGPELLVNSLREIAIEME